MKNDVINSPRHYTSGPQCPTCQTLIECITVVQDRGFLEGNVIKYLWRWREKNGLEDLKKARWYLDRLITSTG